MEYYRGFHFHSKTRWENTSYLINCLGYGEGYLFLTQPHHMWKYSRHTGILLQILVQQNYSHNSDFILTMNSNVQLFLSPPVTFGMPLPSVVTSICSLTHHRLRLNKTRFHSLGGGCSSHETTWKVINFPHSLAFQLTCLINTADCFVNDSFKFSEGKSLYPMHPDVAQAHRANLAYHSEFFRLLSS